MPRNNSYNKPEYKEKMSKAKKGISVNAKEKNPNWQKFKELNPNWKGGKKIVDGYVYLFMPEHPDCLKGYIAEHRLIIEKKMGRRLKSTEVVHHINEIRNDNRIENLQLLCNRAEHNRIHKIKKYCGAICGGGEKKPTGSVHYCPSCKKITGDTMQLYYDDVFCKICGKRKGSI